tara:strand:+ start:796 stop:1893 length:1098 start_codon:yes stop_codon:yes gene_type:complete
MSLSVIFSTKKINEDFVKLIKSTSGVHNIEVLPYENPGIYSLNEVYNMGLEKASNNIIVFCHDDIKFETRNWGRKILKHFNKNESFGIVGVAGTRYLSTTGRWWDDFSKMHGAVFHEHEGKKWLTRYSKDTGTRLTEVALVDGLFFGVNKNSLKHTFDESVSGFHFYDVTFCFSNYLAGIRIGVCTDIRISHLSIGVTNDEWEKNRVIFAEKYKDSLPVKIKRVFSDNDKLDILLTCQSLTEPLMELLLNLKKEHHNVTLCGEYTTSQYNTLKRKNINVNKLNSPPGYAIGDGVWAINTPEGPQPTEKNKLYKVKEIKFDIVHSTHNQMSTYIMPFYPNTPEFKSDDEDGLDGEIIKKYKSLLEW